MKKGLWFFAGVAIALGAALMIGQPSEPELELQGYCANVKAGVWPDYEGTYKIECGGKDPPVFNENLAK